jgi:predicted dehydrogenase
MTTETSHQCPACGATMANPTEAQPPEPARKAYMIEYYAPAGVFYEAIISDDPMRLLEHAKTLAKAGTFKVEDFESDEDALLIHKIQIVDEDGDPVDHWTDPDHFAEEHAAEILDYLESIIEAADNLTEKRHSLDETISDVASCAEDAARRLDALRAQGGVA